MTQTQEREAILARRSAYAAEHGKGHTGFHRWKVSLPLEPDFPTLEIPANSGAQAIERYDHLMQIRGGKGHLVVCCRDEVLPVVDPLELERPGTSPA